MPTETKHVELPERPASGTPAGAAAHSLGRLRELLHAEAAWDNGAFLLRRSVSVAARALLSADGPRGHLRAFQAGLLARLLRAGGARPGGALSTDGVRLPERLLAPLLQRFGVPLLPAARYRRAAQLRAFAEPVTAAAEPVLDKLIERFSAPVAGKLSAAQVRGILRDEATRSGGEELAAFLEAFRSWYEQGGDLEDRLPPPPCAGSLRSRATRRIAAVSLAALLAGLALSLFHPRFRARRIAESNRLFGAAPTSHGRPRGGQP